MKSVIYLPVELLGAADALADSLRVLDRLRERSKLMKGARPDKPSKGGQSK